MRSLLAALCVLAAAVDPETCDGSPGRCLDEASLLQAHVNRIALSSDVPARKSIMKERAHALLSRVQNMAKNFDASQRGVMEILQELKEEVLSMIEIVKQEEMVDQEICDAQYEEILRCSRSNDPLHDVQKQDCSLCEDCENERRRIEGERQAACDAWNDFAAGTWAQMQTACEAGKHPFEAGNKGGTGCHDGQCAAAGGEEVIQVGEMMKFWERAWPKMQELKTACETKCVVECPICDREIFTYEVAFCDLHEHCEISRGCHEHELELYNFEIDKLHVADTPGLNTLGQESYLMHEQILCLVNHMQEAVPKNDTITASLLDECNPQSLRADSVIGAEVMVLDIPRRPPPPAPPGCPVSDCTDCIAQNPECPEAFDAIEQAHTSTWTEGALDGQQLFEFGSVDVPSFLDCSKNNDCPDAGIVEHSFVGNFKEVPVVVPMMSTRGKHPARARIFDVTKQGFKVRVVEPSSEDGPHMDVQVLFLAMSAGVHNVPNKNGDGHMRVEAGRLDTQSNIAWPETIHGQWNDINFQSHFIEAPAFFAALQTRTNNPGDSRNVETWTPFLGVATTRDTKDSANVIIEKHEAGGDVSHKETIGWIAIESGEGCFGDWCYKSGVMTLNKFPDDHSGKTGFWEDRNNNRAPLYPLTLQQPTANPLVVASMNTRAGNNGGWPRLHSTNRRGFRMVIDECKVKDDERTHVAEDISYMAVTRAADLSRYGKVLAEWQVRVEIDEFIVEQGHLDADFRDDQYSDASTHIQGR